jgi:DNA (cytosine-5)-methyltransferase 1
VTAARIKALDLFAGTGWGVACRRLGIKESGVEIMPEAVATRTANGMETIYNDVWDGLQLTAEQHRAQYGSYGLLIASPPCQTFSLAGKGAGRDALNDVLEAIELHAYKDADALLRFGAKHDPRTALVLTPLAYVWRDRPRIVALEQVPTVLPVWEACAEVMREWGYEVETAVLNAEQYGVPQTRKRAILVARRGGPVSLPTPTHSRYYSRTPGKLDPGVKKWVSMAEALGWQDRNPADQVFCPTNLRPNAGFRAGDRPASSLAFGHDKPRWITPDELAEYRETGEPNPGVKLTQDEAAALQSYPAVFRNGNQTHAAKRPLDAPAPTIMFGARSNKVEWIDPALADDPAASGERVTVDEAAALQSYPAGRGLRNRPAPTITGGGTEAGGAEPIAKYRERYTSSPDWVGSTERLTAAEAAALQSYPTRLAAAGTAGGLATAEARPAWTFERPSTTVVGTFSPDVISAPAGRAKGGYSRQNQPGSVKVSQGQAAALQSCPVEPPFVFCGTKTKQFLQIGNAVPPLLAEHILAALVGIPVSAAAQ